MNEKVQDGIKAINLQAAQLKENISNDISSELPDGSIDKENVLAFFSTSNGMMFKNILLLAALRGTPVGPHDEVEHIISFDNEEDLSLIVSPLLDIIEKKAKNKSFAFSYSIKGDTVVIKI